MKGYTDALRGYAFSVHQRDHWVCAYCGLDGKASLSSWLSLSLDHLLPKGHAHRDDPEYMVTSCLFCNVADNRYFDLATSRGLTFDGKSRAQLVEQRKPWVMATRKDYESFWESNVRRG